jgi:hypothetical protein
MAGWPGGTVAAAGAGETGEAGGAVGAGPPASTVVSDFPASTVFSGFAGSSCPLQPAKIMAARQIEESSNRAERTGLLMVLFSGN